VDWAAGAGAAAAAIAGLAAGSAVGVLAARIPDRRNLRPPWRCPRCEAQIHGADLLPGAGWLRLRGRCRSCRQRYGAWYLAAELITAALLAALWLRFGPDPLLPALVYLAVITVALSWIDAVHQRLPDVLTLPSYPAGLILLGSAAPFEPAGGRHFVHALIGMAACWLFFVLQAFIYPAGLGWGDVKLSGVLGLYLGWLGAAAVAAGLIGSFVLAALAGLGLIAAGRATRKSQLPFGPFMLASAIAVIAASGLAGSHL
jgi:leader peptidase (prepilin peptidase)/N-methyltransferase